MKAKKLVVMLFVALLGIVGSATTVMGASLGAEYTMFGIELGWALIIGAVIIALFGYYALNKKGMKALTPVIAILFIAGIALSFVQVTEQPTATTTTGATTFSIDTNDPASGGNDIDNCAWDDDETILTIPLEITGSNNLDGNRSHSNFTLKPVAPSGAKSDELVTIYFSSDYLMKYGGEYVLEETGGIYFANWTYGVDGSASQTDDYEGSMSMLLTDTGWANITWRFDSGTADCFSEELDSIGDKVVWNVKFWTDGGWSQTFNIEAIVIET